MIDTEMMVGMTVLASSVLTALVLLVRVKLTKVPAPQPVRVESKR